MGVRNTAPHTINAWRGLNSFISRSNIDEQSWIDSDNVLVNARGEAEVLRSPKTFTTSPDNALSTVESILTADEFQRTAGNVIFFDGADKSYYATSAGGTPHNATSFGPGVPNKWTSITINETFQRINPGAGFFIQYLSGLTGPYANGITTPDHAPVISYVVNGASTGTVTTSLQMSWAYMSTTTGHVGQPSPLSNVLGPTAAGFDVRIAYTINAAPVESTVDKIIFFMTLDGGTVPYSVLTLATGEIVSVAYATSTHDFVLTAITVDTLTPEPIYNGQLTLAIKLAATSLFAWKDRIFLISDGGLQYSGFESCYIGNPWESWPSLNQIFVPNRNDRAVGGISTQSGALVFGEKDSYLLTGYPSDKVVSPQNAIAITEHMDSMNWNLGITYIDTAVNTPFGVIWVDQTRRIRLWNQRGFPSEIGESLRTELDDMTGALKARWFQHGKNGGYYILTDGTQTLFMMLYNGPDGQVQIGYGKSTTIQPSAMVTATFNNVEHFYIAVGNILYEMLTPDIEGDGWAVDTEIFFKMVIGNAVKGSNFSSIHSMQINGDLEDLEITHDALKTNSDGSIAAVDPQTVVLTDDLESDTGETFYGLVDSDERRYHVVKFSWGTDDSEHRGITTFTANVRQARRAI